MNVAIIYWSAKDADSTTSKIAQEYGLTTEAFRCDVSDTDLVARIMKISGPITGVVANTRVSVVKSVLELNVDDFHHVLSVNILWNLRYKQAHRMWAIFISRDTM